MHGRLPTEPSLVRHQLDFFVPITQAVKAGNFAKFDLALAQQESFYMRMGIYLFLQEKLKNLTCRNLCKRIFALAGGGKVLYLTPSGGCVRRHGRASRLG